MKLGDYLSYKAPKICFAAISAVIWGVFAYLIGAHPVLLWGSLGFFAIGFISYLIAEYFLAKRKITKLTRMKDELGEKYLLGELLPVPQDSVQKEYFGIMKEISRSAIGFVEEAKREKEEYFESVEKWIHEIKTPLTACSLICDNGGDTDKLRREFKKADNCTDVILQYARLRSAEHGTVISETHVAAVTERAILNQRDLLIAAKIGVTALGDFTVFTDAKALGFILNQLLINCAKYCPGCHVTVIAESGTVTVEDDGPGIAPHDLPRIFDRGFTSNDSGTGMGLYIVNEICKRLSVSLSVVSKESEGTRFSLTFPQYEEA